ncbi:MAG: polyprenyl synthetase family protein [Gammaproteobacteria bacterium]
MNAAFNLDTRIEAVLDRFLPDPAQPPQTLHRAMRYSVLGGGKRYRPRLVYATGCLLGLPQTLLDYPAAAVELIHAYSLIHDDLPAMDDDDERRGKPSCHRAYNEATAILAGDALQTLAFEVMASIPRDGCHPESILRAVHALAEASGTQGLVGGQQLDLEAVSRPLELVELTEMHLRKTGALIRASILIPVLLAPDPGEVPIQHLTRLSRDLGLAFQIRDDILDATADAGTLGRKPGGDASHHRATFVTLLGLEEARNRLAHSIAQCREALSIFGPEAHPLRALVDDRAE